MKKPAEPWEPSEVEVMRLLLAGLFCAARLAGNNAQFNCADQVDSALAMADRLLLRVRAHAE